MDLPVALLRNLLQFRTRQASGDEDLDGALADLVTAIQAAVPSFRGMAITMHDGVQPATLTLAHDGGPIETSLRLPFISLDPGLRAPGRIVFWAGRPGAFVDLAADLGYALKTPIIIGRPDPATPAGRDGYDSSARDDARRDHRDGLSSIVLDADLPPYPPVLEVSGLDRQGTVSRAIGLLIDQGHDPDEALDVLARRAAATGLEPHVYAARLLES
ncbi:MAG TPA: hypothetical protein VFP34_14265 [Microlunatus sp.]|nr:hypothetical protein [Microlunatus sp.]